DAAGNLFVSENYYNRVIRISAAGIVTTVAGTGANGFSGDGGPANRAQISKPWGLAVDAAGNLYFGDSGNARVRRVSPGGIITTYAGNGRTAISGNEGPAISAGIGAV